MGIYYTSFLYFGRLCGPTAYERLLEHDAPQTFIKKVASDRWILHAPGKFFKLGWIDPVLEEHEKKAGEVSMREVHRILEKRPEEKKRWFGVGQGDLLTLDKLIKVAANGREDEKPATYICEVSWCSLDLPDMDAHVKYNIRCQ